ncbi:hypothetical protein EV14_1191 [Prochlorococcus sp. MIT 0703]|nr:hypothetical protein EV14_1191 [Prochlorococcus sp. MIT 0703]
MAFAREALSRFPFAWQQRACTPFRDLFVLVPPLEPLFSYDDRISRLWTY